MDDVDTFYRYCTLGWHAKLSSENEGPSPISENLSSSDLRCPNIFKSFIKSYELAETGRAG